MENVSALDVVILAVTLVSVFIGAVRGFAREALSLAIWVLAFIVANLTANSASGVFEPWIADRALRFPIAFGAVFVATLILGSLVSRLIGMLIDATGLSGLDRTLGTLFGAARAGLLLVVIAAVAAPLFADSGWWQASRLMPYLLAAQGETFALLDQVADVVRGWTGGQPSG